MTWLPMYLFGEDKAFLAERVDADRELAWIVNTAPYQWVAREQHPPLTSGEFTLWHIPSGPLPLPGSDKGTDRWVANAWAGWEERMYVPGWGTTRPWFEPTYGGCYSLKLAIDSVPYEKADFGISSFAWLGNHYRPIGHSASPLTQRHWNRLRAWVKKHARRIPRTGAIDGPRQEIYAFPGALQAIADGATRASNPS